jgi:ubiquinone/menaquinone biosynthesis C-methylase UbiE
MLVGQEGGTTVLNPRAILKSDIVDLGESTREFAGVLAPAAGYDGHAPGVTRQFLEDAETYHEKYFDISYSKYQLSVALEAIGSARKVDTVLDIGSGSGPSVLALLDHFPDAEIIATDISPNLLAILRLALKQVNATNRCSTLCLDLNKPWFLGQPFDLAVGAAILHHLMDPSRLIEEVFKAVRPGGALAFFEPFEPGHLIMTTLYRLILARDRSEDVRLSERVASFLRGKLAEAERMKCEPKEPAAYADVDDKWYFTRDYFAEIGERIGAGRTVVAPLNFSSNPFTRYLEVHLRLGLSETPNALPGWAWNAIAEVESATSEACKRDMLLEGCVAFVR